MSEQWQMFHDAFGEGKRYRACQPEDLQKFSFLPEWFLKLWEQDGWAGYRNGLFWTIDPEQFAPLVELWSPPQSPLFPVARTAFGTIYLLKEFRAESGNIAYSVAEIDPHTASYSIVGPGARLFITEAIAKPDYIKDVFWEPKVKRAAKDLGPLEWNEMYAFEPALALGGSGKPETVRKVNLFDHHTMLAQLGELKFVKY